MTKQLKAYTTLHGDVEQVRDKSIRFFGDWGQQVFIPVSLIDDADALEEGPEQDIDVETWWCEKEGVA